MEIARCLAIDPAFILLDEPFSGIDPIAVLELQQIIFELKAAGIGVLITDHNVRETLSVTDRAYIVNGGQHLSSGHSGRAGARCRGEANLPGRELQLWTERKCAGRVCYVAGVPPSPFEVQIKANKGVSRGISR